MAPPEEPASGTIVRESKEVRDFRAMPEHVHVRFASSVLGIVVWKGQADAFETRQP